MHDPADDAWAVLRTLQALVDGRDRDALIAFFDDPAVLIGTSGDGRRRDGLEGYLDAVATGESFRWEWDEVIPFHADDTLLGFAAFGEIVAVGFRAPIRATILARRASGGWRIKQFHGSIPHGT